MLIKYALQDFSAVEVAGLALIIVGAEITLGGIAPSAQGARP
jgi:hypothetical protein